VGRMEEDGNGLERRMGVLGEKVMKS